jgi:hypothetical protein
MTANSSCLSACFLIAVADHWCVQQLPTAGSLQVPPLAVTHHHWSIDGTSNAIVMS